MSNRTIVHIVIALALLLAGGMGGYLAARSGAGQPADTPDVVAIKNDRGEIKEEIRGEVVKQDAASRFVVVKTGDNVLRAIPWDDIAGLTLSERSRVGSIAEGLFDWVARLSLLGGIAAVGFGLWQYRSAQKWKRAEFTANAANEFNAHPYAYNAKLMLDSLQLYEEGRRIKFHPDAPTVKEQYQDVTNREIYEALAVDDDKKKLTTACADVRNKRKDIADCFDAFLHRLERFDDYIRAKLMTSKEARVHLIYWVRLIGDTDIKLYVPEFRQRLWDYIRRYKFVGVEHLLEVYEYPITSQYKKTPPEPPKKKAK